VLELIHEGLSVDESQHIDVKELIAMGVFVRCPAIISIDK
jgi:hypothetical protein